MTKTANLYDRVRKRKAIDNAWRVVHSNGISSKSPITRKQIKEYELEINQNLNRICRQLYQNKFVFLPSEGILQKKPGKTSKRPIVKSPIQNRIVQRSILDVLQSYPPLQPYFSVETSFGGIKDRSVSDALRVVYASIQSGAKFFIRSDIQSFFTKIPKPTILSFLEKIISDKAFLHLFEQAIITELSNLEQLGADKDEFPIYDIGVAQGSCLSPLLGNILLNEFDKKMNLGDITCIRYIDDFIILAPDMKALNAAFKRAIQLLAEHGLNAYDPKGKEGKAEMGSASDMFSFLGCDIKPGMIRPNKKSRRRLITSVEKVFTKSVELMSQPDRLVLEKCTVVDTLSEVSNILKGWGNQYSFCNDINMMREIDGKVDQLISEFLGHYGTKRKKLDAFGQKDDRRRLLGVHLLIDSKKDPIIKKTASNEEISEA
jgi:RNA-directed DNA polymerase